jgi:hypothetical protein
MRPHCAYLLGAALGLATLALAAGLHTPPVAAAPDAVSRASAAMNRALKGDRLPTAAPTEVQGRKVPQPRLPDGCEASVSSMTRSSLAQTPARCLS